MYKIRRDRPMAACRGDSDGHGLRVQVCGPGQSVSGCSSESSWWLGLAVGPPPQHGMEANPTLGPPAALIKRKESVGEEKEKEREKVCVRER